MTHPRPDLSPRHVRRRPGEGGRPWTREQIRAARIVELAPLLQRRGLALRDRGGGNVEVAEYKGLLLKASYWRWPERNLAGNTIDFYLNVLGASFHQAMEEITEA